MNEEKELTDIEKELLEQELKDLLRKLDNRQRNYSILDTKIERIPKQKELFWDFKERLKLQIEQRIRFYLYYGWNGAGKTAIWTYITALLAIGWDCERLGLPYIGSKKNIWVGTKSGSNVKWVIHPYFLWEWSMSRIPQELIEKVNMDNGILKSIIMKNGCKIQFITYDQGSENLQGWNPDWILLDEEPTNVDVWSELKARTRNPKCEMLITMTPLNGLTKVYEFFFEQRDEVLSKACKTYRVSSLDNPFTDKTWTRGMTEEEYRLRVEGSFENPTWLVFNQFFRTRNVVPHFNPYLMGHRDDLKFYRGIDFGVSHPTAVIWLCQDIDDNLYIFDELEEQSMLLGDIVDKVNMKSAWYEFEYTVRDSSSAREWMEIAKLGLRTVPADKNTKGINDMSNRRSWIFLMNDLFNKGKLLISSNCQKLIRELETHYYKEGGKKDGEVNKEGDDLLDALRYTIFLIKKNNSINRKSILERKADEIWRNRESNISWLRLM